MKKIVLLSFLSISSAHFCQIPDWTETSCNGIEYNMYTELENGNAVILDFGSVWCGPCNITAPELQSIWENYGEGSLGVKVFDFLLQDAGSNQADCSDLTSWESQHSLTYPGFANANVSNIYSQYDALYGSGAIPFIIMFIPNTIDPGASTLVYTFPENLSSYDQLAEVLSGILSDNGYWALDIDEHQSNSQVEIVKIVDMLGRETKPLFNSPLIYYYSDGTIKRVYKLEE
jgi:hypothetical protein